MKGTPIVSDDRPTADAGFHRDGFVEVAVVVVSYNSADDIRTLLGDLRREAGTTLLRVIVADNSSADGTLPMLTEHPDVIAVPTGGNLGYSGAINVAMRHVGDAESILVLNPDLRLDERAIPRMLRRLRSDARIGAVVPLLRDADGDLSFSLRREPTVLRAASDAILGRLWKTRPAALSEYDRSPESYAWAHSVDWATGAALLISARAASDIGEWDERFFLYSEETDFQRRLRECGWMIFFEPAAAATHRQGGSGESPDLVALLAVNRVRYIEKYSPRLAGVFRLAVALGEHLRFRDPSRSRAREVLRRRSRWADLPSGGRDAVPDTYFPSASIIIPAHNEAEVIERTLRPFASLAAAGRLEIVVACNGCTDDTAERARSFPGVRVVETDVASKTAALNLADANATRWPRVYLDADIEASPEALMPVIHALAQGRFLAGRPSFVADTRGASFWVRAYFRARGRMPSTSRALWGAGVYALGIRGHARLGSFPAVTADDLYVDRLFGAEEKAFPATAPVSVRMPLTPVALLQVLTRARRGPAQQGVDTASSTLRELVRTVSGPVAAFDALIYASFALAARKRAGGTTTSAAWERDETTRTLAAAPSAAATARVRPVAGPVAARD
jgi:GT2 family glycosyltransferase